MIQVTPFELQFEKKRNCDTIWLEPIHQTDN